MRTEFLSLGSCLEKMQTMIPPSATSPPFLQARAVLPVGMVAGTWAGREVPVLLPELMIPWLERCMPACCLQVRAGRVRREKAAGCDQPLSKEDAEGIFWSLGRSGAS